MERKQLKKALSLLTMVIRVPKNAVVMILDAREELRRLRGTIKDMELMLGKHREHERYLDRVTTVMAMGRLGLRNVDEVNRAFEGQGAFELIFDKDDFALAWGRHAEVESDEDGERLRLYIRSYGRIPDRAVVVGDDNDEKL